MCPKDVDKWLAVRFYLFSTQLLITAAPFIFWDNLVNQGPAEKKYSFSARIWHLFWRFLKNWYICHIPRPGIFHRYISSLMLRPYELLAFHQSHLYLEAQKWPDFSRRLQVKNYVCSEDIYIYVRMYNIWYCFIFLRLVTGIYLSLDLTRPCLPMYEIE